MATLSNRLKALRNAAELSQQGLAKKAGIRQATVSDIETGKATRVTMAVVLKLAKALGETPGALMGLEKPKGKR